MRPEERDALEQALWELRFGCHEDEQTLRRRITTEPEVRTLWDEVQRKAEAVEQAAREPVRELHLAPPARRPSALLRRLTRTAAAAAAVALLAAGWYGGRVWNSSSARAIPEVVVSAPSAVPDGAPLAFTIDVRDTDQRPARTAVRWRALGTDDTLLSSGEAHVTGSQRFEVPASLPGVRRIVVDAPSIAGARDLTLVVDPASASPLVHLGTDKPVHRPGEQVHARAVVLDRRSLEPVTVSGGWRMRVLDPRGEQVESRQVYAQSPEHGVLPLGWRIPDDAVGGHYRLELLDPHRDDVPLASADLLVRRFERPQLRKQLTLARTTFAPGETVHAEIEVERLGGGGPAAGASYQAMLDLDGEEVARTAAELDAQGRATFQLALPETVEKGAARLAVRVVDGGVVETVVRPFVVPTGRVDVRAFPEGGDLVAGFQNRVYFECTDPLGRAVDAAGRVVDDRGAVAAEFASTDHGRGTVSFVPDPERTYALVLDSPADVRTKLPAPTSDGVLLRALDARSPAGAPLRVRVATARDQRLVVAAFCRNTMVGQVTTSGHGVRDLDIPVGANAAGVLRITVFDQRLRPRAERLVQRAPTDPLTIELRPERRELAPRDTQRVAITTRTASGTPIAAVVGIAVSDAAVRAYADQPEVGLLDALTLFADVEALEDRAAFLPTVEGSAARTDLLLGTRGWRRLAWTATAPPNQPERAALLARTGLLQQPRVASNQAVRNEQVDDAQAGLRWARQLLLAVALLGAFAVAAHLLTEAAARAGRWLAPRIANASPDLGSGIGGTLAVVAAAAFLVSLTMFPGSLAQRLAPDAAVAFDSLRATGIATGSMTWAQAMEGEDPLEERVLVEQEVLARDEREPNADVAGRLLVELTREEGLTLFMPDRGHIAVVREYAHRATTGAARRDFTETVLWNPLVVTGADGTARVEFDLADQVTTWLVRADAHGGGAVGQAEARFDARLPLRLEARMPIEVTDGDRLQLPVALEAHGANRAELAAVARGALRLDGAPTRDVILDGGRGRALLDLTVEGEGPASLELAAAALDFRDRVWRELRVVPRGFPHRRSWAGTLEETSTFEVAVPDGTRPRASLRLYPSTLSTIREGLDGMLQEPHGCFEQASSTNYPNVLTLAYLRATGGTAPAIEARARAFLESGYGRLTGYECASRGYEWFGADPGHTALTAYGVLQFADMGEVFAVDGDMVTRTRGWLLERREGDGSFEQDRAQWGFGGAPTGTTAAYATYALLAAGQPADQLTAEVDRLTAHATTTRDAYELALAACALELAQRHDAAAAARDRLATMQAEDGGIDGAVTSITSSGGDDLRVETTGFAVLAWLDDPDHAARARLAVEFLLSQRSGRGTFGATQATICALRALVAWAEYSQAGPASGTVRILVDGREVAAPSFARDQPDAVVVDLSASLSAGTHGVRLVLDGEGTLPWSCELAYHADTPADDPEAPLAITTTVPAGELVEGETVAVRIEVRNRTAHDLPMTIAIVGLPAGIEVPTAVLDDLQRGGAFDLWETRGREVVLYWRAFATEERKSFVLDAVATVPGTTTGPASRAYLYYTPDAVRWAAPLRTTITAVR